MTDLVLTVFNKTFESFVSLILSTLMILYSPKRENMSPQCLPSSMFVCMPVCLTVSQSVSQFASQCQSIRRSVTLVCPEHISEPPECIKMKLHTLTIYRQLIVPGRIHNCITPLYFQVRNESTKDIKPHFEHKHVKRKGRRDKPNKTSSRNSALEVLAMLETYLIFNSPTCTLLVGTSSSKKRTGSRSPYIHTSPYRYTPSKVTSSKKMRQCLL